MIIKILSYFRKDTSTLLAFSAIALLLLASPLLPLSNFLLQPVQATTYTSVQTPNPVALGDNCNVANATITFDAQGSPSSGPPSVTLTSGTFQITDSSSGQILWSGDLYQGSIGSGRSMEVDITYSVDGNNLVCNAGTQLWVTTY